MNYTPHQSRYFAEQIVLKRPQSSIDSLASAMSGVKVDLNPHQVDAALFAMKSPLSKGAYNNRVRSAYAGTTRLLKRGQGKRLDLIYQLKP